MFQIKNSVYCNDTALNLELARQSFLAFCHMLYLPEIFNSTFKNFHHVNVLTQICQEMTTRKETDTDIGFNIEKATISIPPGHSKSSICHHLFIPWLLGNNPNLRIITASHSHGLCKTNMRRIMRVMEHQFYKIIFPNITFEGGVEEISINNHTGTVKISSPDSSGTGGDADFYIIDDPIDAEHARTSIATRNGCNSWYDNVASRRIRTTFNADKKAIHPRMLVIMQRLHVNDLVGHIETNYTDFKHFKLKAIDEVGSSIIIHNKAFIRQEEVLCSALKSKAELNKILQENSNTFYSQYQQEPKSYAESIVKEGDLKYIEYEVMMQIQFQSIYISCDPACNDNNHNDPSALVVFGLHDNKLYIINSFMERLQYYELKKKIIAIHTHYKSIYTNVPFTLLIEEAVTGYALIPELKREHALNVIPRKPIKSKIERLQLANDFIVAGNLHFTKYKSNTQENVNLIELANQLVSFPNVTHDDGVDAISQMINYYREKHQVRSEVYFMAI